MKKKLLIILVLLLSVTVITGCGKEKEKKEGKKTIVLKDSKKGYKTTFSRIINILIHITGGKHRSWQTHSLDIWTWYSLFYDNLSFVFKRT